MSKHTSGPWKWSDEYTHPCGKPAWTLLGRHGLYGILTCDQGSAPQDLSDEANARLIAAAPELLAALEECLSALNFIVEQGGGPHCEHEGGTCFCKENNAISSALDAIAKATGEA